MNHQCCFEEKRHSPPIGKAGLGCRPRAQMATIGAWLFASSAVVGHSLDEEESRLHFSPNRPHIRGEQKKSELLLAQFNPASASTYKPTTARADELAAPTQAHVFDRFAPLVRTRWDDRYLFVESDGLPARWTVIRFWG